MGQKFLIAIFCVSAFAAFAGGMDQNGNTFSGGTASGLSSGGDGSSGGGMGSSYGSGASSTGSPQTVTDYLHGQGMNFYIGAGLGLSMFQGTFITSEGTPPGTMSSHKGKTKNKMPEVALMFGLQQKGIMLTDFGLTAMFGPTIITTKTFGKGGTVTDKNNIKEKYRFVLHGAAGVAVTPSINIFGKLGLVYSGFNIGYKEGSSVVNNAQATRGLGIAPGIMLQYKSSETVSYNLDLSYIMYKTISTNNLAPSTGKYVYKTKISPRIITILLGGSIKLGAGS